MTPDDPRRTCILGHARKRNSNFGFREDNMLMALRGERKLAPAQNVDNVVHRVAQLVFPTG